MKLPNAERAIVDGAKLRGYCLSETHPKGRPKARFFRAHGFDAADPDPFEAALRQIARSGTVVNRRETPFGVSYGVVGDVPTPAGTVVRLQTVWFVRAREEQPRFVTAYPAGPPSPDARGSDADRS